MARSQQSGKSNCELNEASSGRMIIPAVASATSAEAEDKIADGKTERTLSESVFLAVKQLEARFRRGLFCQLEADRQRGASNGGIGGVRT